LLAINIFKRPIRLALTVFLAAQLWSQVDVLTHDNNNARTGANLRENTLKVASVNSKDFGKLAYRTVDGNIYAQPLIVSGAKIVNRGATNVAIVATENNSVYAFDAEDIKQTSTTAQLWRTGLGPAIDSSLLYQAIDAAYCTDITLQIGITSTPVIMITNDQAPRAGVVFVTAKSKSGNRYIYTLFSLDLADGAKLASVPMEGEVNGRGIGSTGSGANAKIIFNPLYQLNRPALLLVGNVLYVAFGGHCDKGPYHGWVFAYDVSNPKTPKKIAVLCTTPNGKGPLFNGEPVEGWGGIWMSGEGPSVDELGNVYLVTGNGSYDGKTEFSDSVLKMKLDGGKLQIQDWFTPQDQTKLKDYDYDLGSGGVAVVPNSHLLLAGGKEGVMYLLDRDNLGKGTGPFLQSFQVTHPLPKPPLGYNIHGTPVIWPRTNEMYVYVMGEESPLRQYRLVPDPSPGGAGWKFETGVPLKSSPESAPYPNFPIGLFVAGRTEAVWMPGGFLALSAFGAGDGTGILWVNMPYAENANHMVVRGVLRAFDASDVSKGELWDSESTGNDNDRLGQFAKFCPPTVANGKVYVATFQQETVLANNKHVKTMDGDRPSLVIYGPRRLAAQ
jgi:hypothetical protein